MKRPSWRELTPLTEQASGFARRLRHLAVHVSVVALCLWSPACNSATEVAVGWPEITVLPINVGPVVGDYAGDVALGPSAGMPFQAKPFLEMGSLVPSSAGPKQIPNFEFYVRASAVVVAPASGVIWRVVFHEAFGDYGILIREGNEGFSWVEVDHVSNPTVRVGDRVVGGQPIGTAGKTNDARLGRVELQVSDANRQPITHFCPNVAFAPTATADIEARLTRLMQDIEARALNSNLYSEATMFRVGCNIEKVVETRGSS